jgi:hypothetical protein
MTRDEDDRDRRARTGELALDVEAGHPGESEVEHEAARPGFPLSGGNSGAEANTSARRPTDLRSSAIAPRTLASSSTMKTVGGNPGWLIPVTATGK